MELSKDRIKLCSVYLGIDIEKKCNKDKDEIEKICVACDENLGFQLYKAQKAFQKSIISIREALGLKNA